jgi:hypothetical protein
MPQGRSAALQETLMRKIAIVGCAVGIACARAGGSADSVAADSVVVSGPPAVPATLPPPPDSMIGVSGTLGKQPTPKTSSTVTPAPAGDARAVADSVLGIVSVTGTSFDKHVMIAQPGGRRIEITGALASLIGHVAGAEVSVAGSLAGARLEATRFVVRSVDGQPAIDGKLLTAAGVLYIVTADGVRTRIVAPPPPLQGQDGARVWITGDPARSVESFGFIDPPR